MVTLLDPAEIPRAGVQRDPGVKATPAIIQDPRASALDSFSRDMNKVAAVFGEMRQKRQESEDSMFLDTYQLEYNKKAAQIEADTLNSPDVSNDKFVDILDKKLEDAQNATLEEVIQKRGFTPSEAGRRKAVDIALGLRSSTARSATQKAHNQRVTSLVATAEENIDDLARTAAATGDLDGGFARLDGLIDGITGFVAPDKARVLRNAGRATLVESVVEGHLARKEYDKAQEIIDAQTGFYKEGPAATLAYPDAEGLVEKGNVDLNARPTVRDGDSIATLRSVSRNIDGVEILVPTVTEDGRIVSSDEAFEIYKKTGKHLGKFETAAAATAYAKTLSANQGKRYGGFSVERAIFNASREHGADPAVSLAIAIIESGGDPSAKNPASSAAGLFQFIAETGTSLGLPADASTASVEDQAKAGAQFIAMNTAALRRSLGGEPTPAEIYLAHFLGAGDAVRVLRSEADTPLSDILTDEVITANPHLKDMTADGILGWAAGKMTDAMGTAAGSIDGRKFPKNAAMLPIDNAIALSKRVSSARKDQKVDLDGLIKDDVASIRSTGEPIGIDENVARSVLTPKEMEDWQGDREDARAYFDATNDMVAIPQDEIMGRLSALEPRAGEVGFARAEKVHSDVEKEAKRIVKLRADDPALSIADTPAVTKAAQEFDPKKPTESWHALIRARQEAQRAIGIPDEIQNVLTKDEARRFSSSISRATEDEFYGKFDQLTTTFETTFGEFADEALKQVVTEFVKDKDQATYATGIIKSLISRQAVPVPTARALDDAAENSGIDSVTKSLSEEDETLRMLRRDPHWQEGQRRAVEDVLTGKGIPLVPVHADQSALQYLKDHPETLEDFIEVYGEDQVPEELRTAHGRR